MYYATSYKDYLSYEIGDFVLSDVTKADLQKFNIQMSVKAFKAMCKKIGIYKIVLTGGAGYTKRTRVYNYYKILEKIK